MQHTTYASIEALIKEAELSGTQVQCIFYHLDGETIRSSAAIPKNNSTMDRVGRTVKGQLLNRARSTASQSIFSLLGGGMLGRAGSMVVRGSIPNRSMIPNEPDEEDIQNATIAAFKKVSSQYEYDETEDIWIAVAPQKQKLVIKNTVNRANTDTSQNKSSEKETAGQLNRFEKEVLARLLVEISDADGSVSGEEEFFLKNVIPRELGTIDQIRKMDSISPVEIRSLTLDSKLQILKSAMIISFSDLQPHENEMGLIQDYSNQMGLSSSQYKQLQKEAKIETLSNIIDEHTSRTDLLEIARQLNIPEEEAEMALIDIKSKIR